MGLFGKKTTSINRNRYALAKKNISEKEEQKFLKKKARKELKKTFEKEYTTRQERITKVGGRVGGAFSSFSKRQGGSVRSGLNETIGNYKRKMNPRFI